MSHPGGRPTIFNQSIADEICFRMANGESARVICRDDHMPCIATVFNWLKSNKQFLEQYEIAKEQMVECFASEMTEIADDSTNDFYEKALKNGDVSVVGDMELVNRAKLRVETRKWVCERLMPKRYGPKSDLNIGGQSENPLSVVQLITSDDHKINTATIESDKTSNG